MLGLDSFLEKEGVDAMLMTPVIIDNEGIIDNESLGLTYSAVNPSHTQDINMFSRDRRIRC